MSGRRNTPGILRTQAWLLAAIVLVLFVTTDDRHAGQVGDGRQMIWTAIAIAETGEIGQARGRDLAVPRGADAVSRFGMGMTLAQVPAAWLAPEVEERHGAGASQPLFLIAPFVFVIAAGLFASAAARELGATVRVERIALVLATLGSPLAAYAAMDFSEPLQAAALAGAFAASLNATRPGNQRWKRAAAWAGACAGIAVLTKSSLVVVAPLALLPLGSDRGQTGVKPWSDPGLTPGLVAAAAGAAVPISIWAAFEFVRFGRLFGGYEGEAFSHPWLDGAWRLLVSPNTGLLLFFPALAVALVAAARLMSSDNRRSQLAAVSALAVLAALLATAAGWWAWHGANGWGPRLIIPAVPLLAAIAAIEIARWPTAAVAAMLAISVALNIPPLLQHPVPVLNYRLASAWPEDATEAARVPAFARRTVGGRVTVMPDQILSRTASASPFVTLLWFRSATHADSPDGAVARLSAPPWIDARPDITPPSISRDVAAGILSRNGWRWWGRGFAPDSGDEDAGRVYQAGLANQVIRAQQLGRAEDALALSTKLVRLAPDGFHDALVLESYRLLRRRDDAAAFLTSRPSNERQHPAINVVLALFERDAGNDADARTLLATSAPAYPDSPVERSMREPLSAWPADFASMTANVSLEVRR